MPGLSVMHISRRWSRVASPLVTTGSLRHKYVPKQKGKIDISESALGFFLKYTVLKQIRA
jgi:hypothetical protein